MLEDVKLHMMPFKKRVQRDQKGYGTWLIYSTWGFMNTIYNIKQNDVVDSM